MKSIALLFLVLLCGSVRLGAGLTPEEIKDLPTDKIEAQLPDEHPSAYYQYATRLFHSGSRDQAVFWFYVGQLRYRVHLKTHPKLDPSGDPALFASLNAAVGRVINEYAGGDPKMWAVQMDQALRWDAAHPNGFTSKKEFKQDYDDIRDGLAKFRKQIEDSADRIREERKKRGLENRS